MISLEKARTWLDICLTLAMLGVSVVVLRGFLSAPPSRSPANTPPPLPVDPIVVKGLEIEGRREAALGIIAFSDFECPFCGEFARDVLPEIRTRYLDAGRAYMAFAHFPIESIHKNALSAAAAAVCAGRSGAFRQFHDALFAQTKPDLSPNGLATAATKAGTVGTSSECPEAQAIATVRGQIDLAKRLGVRSTPTFLIGRRLPSGDLKAEARLLGARPFSEFSDVLEKIESGSPIK